MSTHREWVCLNLLPGLGPAGLWRLIHYYGSPAEVLRQPVNELIKVEGVRKSQLSGFSSLEKVHSEAESQIKRVQSAGGTILSWEDNAYPELLRQIPDPPPVLYTLGNISLLKNCCVAVVGSRSATGYGRRISCSFAEKLSREMVTVVSGLALGIDAEAHKGALSGDGSTIAVLGCGLDVVYPKQNSALYSKIRDNGLLITEYPLGTRPEGFRFPARNRIIAGLSQGIVVVEAARKSGSLITAQLGLDFGREVFGVPGQADSYKSEGTHWLIQQGAQLVISVEDVLEGIRFSGVTLPGNKRIDEINILDDMEPEMRSLMQQLDVYPQTIDEVLDKTQLSVARGSELLLLLELEGLIEMGPGDLVCKVR